MIMWTGPKTLTPEDLLMNLKRQREEIKQQLLQQHMGLAMIPSGQFPGIRRATQLLINSMLIEDANLELAISVLKQGGPNCLASAAELLDKMAEQVEPTVLGHAAGTLH